MGPQKSEATKSTHTHDISQSDPNQCQMLLPKMKATLMEMKIDLSARDAGEGAMAFSQSFETVRPKL